MGLCREWILIGYRGGEEKMTDQWDRKINDYTTTQKEKKKTLEKKSFTAQKRQSFFLMDS